MRESLREIVRRHARPLEPIPTGVRSRLDELPGVRAVLFDIYGTLLISAGGDVRASAERNGPEAFEAALAAVGIRGEVDGKVGTECLLESIQRDHQRAADGGVDHPEIDIREIWPATLATLPGHGALAMDLSTIDLESLALHYEMRVNPVWPMPHAGRCLAELAGAGLRVGLISNAQFHSVGLLATLLGRSVEQLGFDPDLEFLSYQYRRAKPGREMFELAAKALAERGIRPEQAVYVGNDMLNDILPAGRLGFRTALFAGDGRSLRLRPGDERVAGVCADLIVTDLLDLARCLVKGS